MRLIKQNEKTLIILFLYKSIKFSKICICILLYLLLDLMVSEYIGSLHKNESHTDYKIQCIRI